MVVQLIYPFVTARFAHDSRQHLKSLIALEIDILVTSHLQFLAATTCSGFLFLLFHSSDHLIPLVRCTGLLVPTSLQPTGFGLPAQADFVCFPAFIYLPGSDLLRTAAEELELVPAGAWITSILDHFFLSLISLISDITHHVALSNLRQQWATAIRIRV